jgi:hypothetical protein
MQAVTTIGFDIASQSSKSTALPREFQALGSSVRLMPPA